MSWRRDPRRAIDQHATSRRSVPRTVRSSSCTTFERDRSWARRSRSASPPRTSPSVPTVASSAPPAAAAEGVWPPGTRPPGSGSRTRRPAGRRSTYGLGDQLFLASPSGPMRELSAPTLSVRGRIAVPPGSADHQVFFVRGLLVAAGERGQLVHDLERHRRSWSSATHGCETFAVSTGSRGCSAARRPAQSRSATWEPASSTGRLLDPQFGALTDLVVYAQRDGTEALVGFQKDGLRVCAVAGRWPRGRSTPAGAGRGGDRWVRPVGPDGVGDPSASDGGARRDHGITRPDRCQGHVMPSGSLRTTIGVIASRPLLVDVPSGRVDPTTARRCRGSLP